MQHILLNITKEPDTHIEIVGHCKGSTYQWAPFNYPSCRVSIFWIYNLGDCRSN